MSAGRRTAPIEKHSLQTELISLGVNVGRTQHENGDFTIYANLNVQVLSGAYAFPKTNWFR